MAGKRLYRLREFTAGKVRRFFLAHTRRGRRYIALNHTRRRGQCARCGVCCHMLVRCPFLRMEDTLAVCSIHPHRPANCSIFPVDERDLAERDLVDPNRPCGFRFVADEKP